jgi:hypothetical protein
MKPAPRSRPLYHGEFESRDGGRSKIARAALEHLRELERGVRA